MEKINKRNKVLLFAFLILMLALTGRLFYIQVICHEELEEAASSQYEVAIEGLDTRGVILDRNYRPLTGGTKQYYYFISKEYNRYDIELLTRQIEGRQIATDSSAYYVYRTEKYNKDINDMLRNDFGAYVFQSAARYSDEQMACHLIGYLNEDENIGVSGLELLCEKNLKQGGKNLCLCANAAGEILMGVQPSISGENATNMETHTGIVTTIDRRLQYVAESALKSQTDSGAVVVMDAETGEIEAWASTPTFNPNEIECYLLDGSDCLINKVSQSAYPPGSVFKIVTALAALENGITTEEKFECKGEVTVEGITLGCTSASEEGHGMLDMEEAMAVSCNCYYALLGEKVGYEKLLETASKLGFGQKTMENFPEESKGNLPEVNTQGTWDTSNLSIGQGELLATPMQICTMTAAVANGGKLVTPRILKDEKGYLREAMSEENAGVIENLLKAVMTEGTGKGLWSEDVYGKTGTAEAGNLLERHNICWFTGYCRLEEKTYAITVMAEGGVSGSVTALPVFKKIVDFLGRL